jgi:drug/metabolite transporter (DMT)-like permease
MSLYVYLSGAAGLLVVALFDSSSSAGQSGVSQLFAMGSDITAWGLLLLLAVAQTIGALYAYTAGLRHLEAATASIIATFEPLVAACLAYFVLHESLEWPQLLGGAFILAAVILLQRPARARIADSRRAATVDGRR